MDYPKAEMDRIEIRAQSAHWYRGVEILMRGSIFGQPPRRFSTNLQFEEANDEAGYLRVEPTARLSRDDAQTLMDDLWMCGLRPTEGMGSAGSLKATERHLEDMRKIAFSKLNLRGVE